MEKFKIEKAVPLASRSKKYPFGEMEIGDSFIVPLTNKLAGPCARTYGNKNNKKFTIRTLEDGIRIWRTK